MPPDKFLSFSYPGHMVLEKKIFEKFTKNFNNSSTSTLVKKRYFDFTTLNPLCPRVLYAKFGWNLSSGSGEDIKNVKSLHKNSKTKYSFISFHKAYQNNYDKTA